jgi:hypothetical protein
MRQQKNILGWCLAAAAIAWVKPAQAERRALAPVADSTIFSKLQGGTSYDTISDGGPNVWVSTTGSDVVRRGLLRFDLSGIPQGSRITSAELKLTQLRARAGHVITVHKVLASWQAAASTAGDFGQGTTALPGDVTWSHRSHPTQPWAQRGGDHVAQASTAVNVSATSTFTYTWPSTPQFLADVQSWVDQPASNHGVILIGDEVNSYGAKRFAGAEFDDAEVVPMLVVDWTPPEPTQADGDVPLPAWALLALGAGLLATVRARWA